MAWLRDEGGAIVLDVHVQPGAKQSTVAGLHGDALRIRIAAAPVEGRANAELARFLAELFGVPQRQVHVLRGETSRRKQVRIVGPVSRPDREWTF